MRDEQCALNRDAIESALIVSSVTNKPSTLSCVYHLSTDDLLWRNFLSPQCRNCSRDPDRAYDFLFDFNRNHASILYRFQDITSYLSKVADFDPPHLYLAPLQGVTPVEFRGDLWHPKTRVPGLSCGVVCVILRFAVLVEHWLVTDGHRHRPMASTADA